MCVASVPRVAVSPSMPSVPVVTASSSACPPTVRHPLPAAFPAPLPRFPALALLCGGVAAHCRAATRPNAGSRRASATLSLPGVCFGRCARRGARSRGAGFVRRDAAVARGPGAMRGVFGRASSLVLGAVVVLFARSRCPTLYIKVPDTVDGAVVVGRFEAWDDLVEEVNRALRVSGWSARRASLEAVGSPELIRDLRRGYVHLGGQVPHAVRGARSRVLRRAPAPDRRGRRAAARSCGRGHRACALEEGGRPRESGPSWTRPGWLPPCTACWAMSTRPRIDLRCSPG